MGNVTAISINSDNRALIRAAMTAPLLEKQHELDLARRWRDQKDQKALDELTRSYLRLVVSIANRFRHYGLINADLVQEGTIGLMEAAARFDPERDLRFSTYASWWVRASVQDYVLRNWSIVRTGTTAAHKSLFFNLRRLRAKITGTPDGQLSFENRRVLANQLGIKLKDIETMEARLTGGDVSLNQPVGSDDGDSWENFLVCEAPRPDEVFEASNDQKVRAWLLDAAMAQLNPRERIIISKRQLSEDHITLAALGVHLKISKERVRQIEGQALAKLKASMLAIVSDPVQAGIVNNMS